MGNSITEKLGATPIMLYHDRCLNSRHRQSKCIYCAASCPTGALGIENGKVSLSVSACTGCGACLSTCPMEVFTSESWSERYILGKLAEMPGERVRVLCARQLAPQPKRYRANIVRIKVCLGSISPGLLFEAGLKKEIQLCTSECAVCERASLFANIEKSAALANAWLIAVGRQACIVLSNERPVFDEDRTWRRFLYLRAQETQEADVGRREFLAGFARSGSSLFAAFAGGDRERVGPIDSRRSANAGKCRHIHRWREKLFEAYPRKYEAMGPGALWPQMTVSDACTGCGACEQYCPSEAIRSEVKGGRMVRVFTPGLCADCALCALACPVGAVTREYAAQSHPFNPQVVLDKKVEECSRCHVPAIGTRDRLCHWCASELPIEFLLSDAQSHLLPSD